MKTLNSRQWAAVKRVAQNVNPLLTKRRKLEAQMATLSSTIKQINEEIDLHESGVKAMTGRVTEELVHRVVSDNKAVSYEPNTTVVSYVEETKSYNVLEETDITPVTDSNESEIIDTPVTEEVNND